MNVKTELFYGLKEKDCSKKRDFFLNQHNRKECIKGKLFINLSTDVKRNLEFGLWSPPDSGDFESDLELGIWVSFQICVSNWLTMFQTKMKICKFATLHRKVFYLFVALYGIPTKKIVKLNVLQSGQQSHLFQTKYWRLPKYLFASITVQRRQRTFSNFGNYALQEDFSSWDRKIQITIIYFPFYTFVFFLKWLKTLKKCLGAIQILNSGKLS